MKTSIAMERRRKGRGGEKILKRMDRRDRVKEQEKEIEKVEDEDVHGTNREEEKGWELKGNADRLDHKGAMVGWSVKGAGGGEERLRKGRDGTGLRSQDSEL